MADIVDKLIWMDTNTLDVDVADLCVEARLEIERLRNAGDALVGALENGLMGTAALLMQDWREARRG